MRELGPRLSFKLVETRIKSCLQMFLSNDAHLIRVGASERCMAHKLAEYMQMAFRLWHVDCEYNRDKHEDVQKVLLLPRRDQPDITEEHSVYPDIIVHRRGSDRNLLVVEMKKTLDFNQVNTLAFERDRLKLRTYVEHLHYDYALFLILKIGKMSEQPHKLEWLKR